MSRIARFRNWLRASEGPSATPDHYDNDNVASPADVQPTAIISPDNSAEDTSSRRPEETLISDPTFQYVETLFTSTDTNRVPFIDSDVGRFAYASRQEFTADELAHMDTDGDELLARLQTARQALDKLPAPSLKRLLTVDGTARRAQNKKYHAARDAFDSLRQEYLDSIKPTNEQLNTPLAKLTLARAAYAEAAAGLRGNRKQRRSAKKHLANSKTAYLEALDSHYNDIICNHVPPEDDGQLLLDTPAAQSHFAASFKEREQGALAGEEAYTYLAQTDDPGFFAKTIDRYNSLSRPRKIVAGLAVAGLAGIGFGAIGGGAAIGGMIGARFGRRYFTEHAKRRDSDDRTTQQQRAVLHAGNVETAVAERQRLIEITRDEDPDDPESSRETELDEAVTAMHADHLDASRSAIDNERRDARRTQSKIVGKAAIISAIPFIGGTVGGVIIEHFAPSLPKGIAREWPFHGDTATDAPSTPPEAPDPADAQPDPDSNPDPGPEADTSDVSARADYLYSDYAGQPIDVTVTASNGSIWQAVKSDVLASHPDMTAAEHERVTANIVAEILAQNPTIDPYAISAGTSIHANVPR